MPASDVDAAIGDFQRSELPGAWPNIGKGTLIDDVLRVVADPFAVNQGQSPLCGPASIVFELASRDLAVYVRICQSLFETGAFESHGGVIHASDTLRESPLPTNLGLSVADWMLMATLRDDANLFFHVDATSGSLVMGTAMPWDMTKWTKTILGLEGASFVVTALGGDEAAMQKADSVRRAGGVAFLLVSSGLLDGAQLAVPYPNHWVSYLGGLDLNASGRIRFSCYSWGQTRLVDMPRSSFGLELWGAVFGES